MNKRFLKYEIIGFVFVNILGTLTHFVYDWTGQNIISALFCPVNESVWEHLKLLFFPFLIYMIYEFYKSIKNESTNSFLLSKLIGIEIGMFITLSIHYLYTGATGKESMVVDILSFIIGVGIAFLISYIITTNNIGSKFSKIISIIFFSIQGIMLIAFTFLPPHLPIFMDSQTMTYGI